MNVMQLADDSERRLESIATDIEFLQATAVLRVAERLADAREIFRYRRDEGGFTGWVEARLKFSQSTAYKLLDVHERFGKQCFHIVETLPRSVLYLLAAPSTPGEAIDAVLDLAANGEKLTHAKVKDMIAQAKQETADEYEQRIERLTTRYQEQEAQLRKDLAAMSPAELEKTITDALTPLQEKIKRLEDERNKRHEAKPKREDLYGRQAAGIINSLHYFASELSIDAGKFIAHQKIVADATGQSLKAVMTECANNASMRPSCLPSASAATP